MYVCRLKYSIFFNIDRLLAFFAFVNAPPCLVLHPLSVLLNLRHCWIPNFVSIKHHRRHRETEPRPVCCPISLFKVIRFMVECRKTMETQLSKKNDQKSGVNDRNHLGTQTQLIIDLTRSSALLIYAHPVPAIEIYRNIWNICDTKNRMLLATDMARLNTVKCQNRVEIRAIAYHFAHMKLDTRTFQLIDVPNFISPKETAKWRQTKWTLFRVISSVARWYIKHTLCK